MPQSILLFCDIDCISEFHVISSCIGLRIFVLLFVFFLGRLGGWLEIKEMSDLCGERETKDETFSSGFNSLKAWCRLLSFILFASAE